MSDHHEKKASHGNEHGSSAGGAAPGGMVGKLRAFLFGSRIKAIISLGICILILGGVLGGLMLGGSGNDSAEEIEPDTMEAAWAALADDDREEARRIVGTLMGDTHPSAEELREPLTILGFAMLRDAEEQFAPEARKRLFTVAARYLEEADKRGFPEGKELEGYFQLGRAWSEAERFERAIPPLLQAFESEPTPRSETLRLLAEAYLKQTPSDMKKARRFNRALLASEGLAPLEIERARLREAHVCVELNDLAGAREAIAQVEENTSLQTDYWYWRGRLRMAEAEELKKTAPNDTAAISVAFEEALEALRSVPAREGSRDTPPPAALLHQAICQAELGRSSDAIASLERLRRRFPDSAESIPAALNQAELMLESEPEKGVVVLKALLARGAESGEYRNSIVPHELFERRITDYYDALLAASKFDQAAELAESTPGWLSAWRLSLWKANAHETAAKAFDEEAAKLPPSKAEAVAQRAASEHRRAGKEYARLAELRFAEPEYIDDLWRSAYEYLRGRDYERAVTATRKFLKAENRKRRPEALTALGEALLCLGKTTDAIAVLEECTENFARHPSAYRARILAAKSHLERGEPNEAMRVLDDNLFDEDLEPSSTEWKDSLFLLGRILFRGGVEFEAKSRVAGVDESNPERQKEGFRQLDLAYASLQRSIEQLTRAVDRYPHDSQSIEARYMIGEAYRRMAIHSHKRLQASTVESTRAAHMKHKLAEMRNAVAAFEEIITHLSDVQDSPDRTQLEKNVLRNSYFAKADALFDLERYDEAIKAYSAASNRYQNEPESLKAYVQIAGCYRLLNKSAEARGTLEQAKVVLKRMKSEADFAKTTPYSREEWSQLLDWLASR